MKNLIIQSCKFYYFHSMIFKNSHIIDNLELNYKLDISLVEGVIVENSGNSTIITVRNSALMISNCQLTLAYLSTSSNFIVPGLFLENSVCLMESSVIKGNLEHLTMGCLAYKSNLKVINSIVMNHRVGGILGITNESNYIAVHKTKLSYNTGAGILIKGKGGLMIQENLFEKNSGVGINIIDSDNFNLISNKIVDNLLDGVSLINSNGIVILNSFFKNKHNGIIVRCTDNKEFNLKIMKNTIIENYKNGIDIAGNGNNPLILYNERIAYNNLAGISVSEKASPIIRDNKIYENMNQGILVVSRSSAEIESNEIYKNIKANIAFGGFYAEKTKIIKNKIYGSRSEGIFLIKGSGGLITENEIYENNDGLIISNSKPEISYNRIYNNLRTGVILNDKSLVRLIGNTIHDNQFLGLFIKEESGGDFLNNDLNLNISQLYLSYDCNHLYNDIKNKNNISGRVDVSNVCNII